MYKYFLSLRYLRSRIIAYFAMLSVALCVAMMIIVVSVMNGFLNKIEHAAKGLFGDIVVDTAGVEGMAGYDEFIAAVQRDVDEVEAASPFVLSYGILRIPGQAYYREGVQIAGIRLAKEGRDWRTTYTAVSDFENGLHFQAGSQQASFNPPPKLLRRRVDEEIDYTEKLEKAKRAAAGEKPSVKHKTPLRWFTTAVGLQSDAARTLRDTDFYTAEIEKLEEQIKKARKDGVAEETIDKMMDHLDQLKQVSFEPPARRVILGLGISGLSFRMKDGRIVRYMVPGHKVVLYVFPLGRGASLTSVSPNVRSFSVVDDCRTDVSSIDSKMVYVPFETLQELNNMAPRREGDVLIPGRCSQIHIKVKNHLAGEAELRAVAQKIRRVWESFRLKHPDAALTDVYIQTWRQRQAQIVGPIESQRTLVVTMFAVMSLVSVVLVFVIFYTIVIQKTADIGVLKAIGASSSGVAMIFLAWGAAVGLVGSVFGSILGYTFVRNINPIHDWMGRAFGFQVWSKEWFLFDKIPNEVRPLTVLMVVAAAILSGLIGALVPAIRAANMQPVEALRYE